MGVKIKNIVGLRFGRLLVENAISGKGQKTLYFCKCDCGNTYEITYKNLQNGTQSCGCLWKEARDSHNKRVSLEGMTHGGSKHPFYPSWSGMMQRGNNPNDKDYHKYGALGRTVCDRWADPVAGFWAFVEDMGPREDDSFTLDRIDNNKGYYPENCRWADKTTQVFNRNWKRRPGITKSGDRWRVQMSFKNKKILDKITDTYEEAVTLREEAELECYGEVWSGQILD